MPPLRLSPSAALTAAAFLAALALHWGLAAPWLARTDSDFDAIHVYLPMAKELLSQGLAYLATERSIQAPPFAFAWPALWGAELATVKLVNLVLSGATLLLVSRTAWIAHSRAAAIAAAFLFALSPLLRPFIATPIAEPPFLFLCAAWIWAVAEWLESPRMALAVVAGIALGLAVLTRGTMFYLVPLLLVAFWWKRMSGLVVAHGIALAIALAFIAKNVWLFSFAFFATGAGSALYLGTSPVSGGYDAFYLGLIFDTGAIARDQSQLTLEAERMLKGVARMLIAQTDPLALAAQYARKLGAFVFVTGAEPDAAWLRAWRIALLVLSLPGLAAIRIAPLRWIVAGTLAYQVAVHIPVLYTHRYSVGAMDLWLVLLAGIGIASLAQSGNRRSLARWVIAIALAIVLGAIALRGMGRPEPDVFRAAHKLAWEGHAIDVANSAELAIPPSPEFHPWFNYVLVVESASNCRELSIAFKPEGAAGFGPALVRELEDDGLMHVHQLGAIVPLRLNGPGVLRLEAPCARHVRDIAVYSAIGAIDYHDRYLAKESRARATP